MEENESEVPASGCVFRWTPEELREELHVYGGLLLIALGLGLLVFGGFQWSAGLRVGSVLAAWGSGALVVGGGLFYLGVRT
jgi:hypothetical protein